MKVNVPVFPPFGLQSALQIIFTIAVSILTLRIGTGLFAWRAANVLEQPTYTIVKRLPLSPPSSPRRGDVEVRKYEPYLIAETTVDESSFRKAGGKGFGKCAGYIFGKNEPRAGNGSSEKMAMTSPVRSVGDAGGEKMAMTAPVTSSGSASSKKTRVSFVIGSKYSLQSAPRPIDKSVRVKRVDGHYLAATSFSGPPPSDDRIRTEITPNILRKNEVAVRVDGSSIQ